MAEETDLTDLIAARAEEPLKSESDGESATDRSLNELIAADKHICSKAATGSAWGRVRMSKAIPPDATGRC